MCDFLLLIFGVLWLALIALLVAWFNAASTFWSIGGYRVFVGGDIWVDGPGKTF